MKHYSPTALERAARSWLAGPQLPSEADLKIQLRERLDQAKGDKITLARQLGITPFQMTLLLRGRGRITDKIAGALGYRPVVRFEPID